MAARGEDYFKYRDPDGILRRLCPAKIDEHVMSPPKWVTGFTVNYLVFQDWEKERCVVCDRIGANRRRNGLECSYMECVNWFKNEAGRVDRDLVEIREAGALGMGAFAKADIPKYQLLGEYLGELVPEDLADDDTDQYYFNIAGAYTITAREYGNWTRFVNHHCDPNVSVAVGMYGHRRSIIFRANRDIAADEQLFIHYGGEYFDRFQMRCNCDGDMVAPHDPGVSDIPFPWPRS